MAKQETSEQELKKIYKLANKLRNKLHRADINFICQIHIRSQEPDKLSYAVSMSSPAEGLAPIMFLAQNYADLEVQLKAAVKDIDYDEVERAYHRAQILACENTKKGHEERLAELDKPVEERGTKVVEGTKERPDNGSKEDSTSEV